MSKVDRLVVFFTSFHQYLKKIFWHLKQDKIVKVITALSVVETEKSPKLLVCLKYQIKIGA